MVTNRRRRTFTEANFVVSLREAAIPFRALQARGVGAVNESLLCPMSLCRHCPDHRIPGTGGQAAGSGQMLYN